MGSQPEGTAIFRHPWVGLNSISYIGFMKRARIFRGRSASRPIGLLSPMHLYSSDINCLPELARILIDICDIEGSNRFWNKRNHSTDGFESSSSLPNQSLQLPCLSFFLFLHPVYRLYTTLDYDRPSKFFSHMWCINCTCAWG